MSLNDTTLEGDFYNTSNFDQRYHMQPWSGEGRAPSAPTRYRINSFVGTTVKVDSMDGVPIACSPLCILQEVSDKGFLLKVKYSAGDYAEGVILFCSTIAFRSVPQDD